MKSSETTSIISTILLGLLAFWFISFIFAVAGFIGFALLLGHLHGSTNPGATLMVQGLGVTFMVVYAVCLFFVLRFVINRSRPR